MFFLGCQQNNVGEELYNSIFMSETKTICNEVLKIMSCINSLPNITDDDCFDIKVIVSELFQNVLRNGNMYDKTKKIKVRLWLVPIDKIEITVEDEGYGFNASEKTRQEAEKTLMLNEVSEFDIDESGRGLLIISSLCDEIICNNRNIITVTKKIAH